MKNPLSPFALSPAEILLPAPGVDPGAWAVVACDQYSAQPEYWRKADETVGDAPSTLRLIYPEAFLESDAEAGIDRAPAIHEAMRRYLAEGVLHRAVSGMVYVERQTGATPRRRGLVAALDLECYAYEKTSPPPMIRPTEGTIAERIPPRVRIRRDAPLELPHILVLYDDPADALMSALTQTAQSGSLRPLYDTQLMLGGGRVRGWAVEREGDMAHIAKALGTLDTNFLFAVGDGNHSLATAKACWEERKSRLSPEQAACHPARYALCELINLHDEGLAFHPIHRVLFGVDAPAVEAALGAWCSARGAAPVSSGGVTLCRTLHANGSGAWRVDAVREGLPLALLQAFLDDYLRATPSARIDYVHGDADAAALGQKPGNMALLLDLLDKSALFPYVAAHGALPRKAFSMGEADEKRYYMEARAIL